MESQNFKTTPLRTPQKIRKSRRKIKVRPVGVRAILEGSLVSIDRSSIIMVVKNNYFLLH